MSDPQAPYEIPEVRLKDLRAGLPPVHVLGRVVTLARREVTGRNDGRRRTVLSGLLSDGTASVRFTWWDPPAEGIDRGTVLRAVNAQVREFLARPELSFGWSTRVAPASEAELPTAATAELPLQTVAALRPYDEGFRLEVQVVDVTDRTVTVGEERRSVHSGRVADASGSLSFTAWVDFRLRPGETVRILGGFVRPYRGALELTLDERSHVERMEALAGRVSTPRVEVSTMGSLEGSKGGADVRVEGLVVELTSPSGVVYRCPTCRRLLNEGICRDHGHVDGSPDLRVRLALDDGTGVVTIHFARDLSERLTGRSLEQWKERARTEPDAGQVERELRQDLVGRRLGVRGRCRVDEFGASLFAVSFERLMTTPEPATEPLARRLAGLGA